MGQVLPHRPSPHVRAAPAVLAHRETWISLPIAVNTDLTKNKRLCFSCIRGGDVSALSGHNHHFCEYGGLRSPSNGMISDFVFKEIWSACG